MPVGFSLSGGASLGFDDALLLAGEMIRAQWVAIAQRYSDTGRYAKSIRVAGVAQDGPSFVVTIEANAPYALVIEDGRAAFNLAEKIRWGQTQGQRINKKGEPYIIVPFKNYAYVSPNDQQSQGISRSALRGIMPREVHEMAKALEASHFTGGKRTYVHYANPAEGRTPVMREGRQQFSEPRNYAWGTALSGLPPQYARRFNRTYKFSGGGQTSYKSFRTIKPGSTWQIPEFVGRKMAEQALQLSAERAADIIATTLVAKIEAVITNGTGSS